MSSTVGPAVTSTFIPASDWPTSEHFQNAADDHVNCRQSSFPFHSARQRTGLRIDKIMSSSLQNFHIGPNRRMMPHFHIHRGRKQHRSRIGEIERGKKIVRDSVRELTQYIRGRGNHCKQLDRLGQADMMNIPVLSGRNMSVMTF